MSQLITPLQVQSAAEDTPPWRVWEPFSPRFDHFSVHQHSGYEFFLHVRGAGLYQLDQQIFPLQPYQLLAIRPHQTHGPVSRQPLMNFERLLFQVSEGTLAQLRCGGVSAQALVDQCIAGAPAQVLLTPQDYQQLSALAGMIPPPRGVSTPVMQMEALGCIGMLLSRFCQALTDASSLEKSLACDHLLQQIHDHILSHFMEDCSLETLAERFSISKFHLSRRFGATYGVGLHRFVTECRIAYAQRLIRQGDPMMSVSYQCGFNDYSAFIRAFTRHTGINPRTWRKQLLPDAHTGG